MLREMSEAMRDEKARLIAFVLAEAREELVLALWVESGGGLISDQEPNISAHEAHEHSRPSFDYLTLLSLSENQKGINSRSQPLPLPT